MPPGRNDLPPSKHHSGCQLWKKRHNEKLLLVRNDVQPTNLSESSKHLNRNSNVYLIRFNLGNSQFSIVTFCYISPDNCTIIFLNIHRIPKWCRYRLWFRTRSVNSRRRLGVSPSIGPFFKSKLVGFSVNHPTIQELANDRLILTYRTREYNN